MKRVIIIHQWMDGPEGDWRPWLRTEIEKRGYAVSIPQMPDMDVPVIEKWVNAINEVVGAPDAQTYFIGHSIGCLALMKYFETLSTPIGGAVFVAGWFNLAGLEEEGEEIMAIARPWIKTSVNFEAIKKICPHTTVLLSSNEPYGYVEENKKIFEEKLDAKVIVLENRGHFTEADGATSLPEALDEFLKLAS